MNNTPLIALVTGGARRVGRAIVLRLAEAGYDVAFTYHASEAAALEVVEQLQKIGRRAIAIQADLTDPAAAVSHIEKTVRTSLGGLNVLVNNASLYEPSSLTDATTEQMRRLWAIHAESPLLLCRAFADDLRKNGGSVINMLDLLAERPWPKYLAYCASKAALWNITLSLARELAPHVTVNGVAPGVVEWPEGYPEAERKKYLSRVPLGRVGEPRDVADAVHFLCTTGRYITGQVLRLDGGRSIS